MKKILCIISLNNFDLESFEYTKKYLESKKFEIITSSKINKEEFEKVTKTTLDINLNQEEIIVKDYSAILLISETSSSKNYLNDATINDILNDAARLNVFSGSISKESKKEIKNYIDGFLEII